MGCLESITSERARDLLLTYTPFFEVTHLGSVDLRFLDVGTDMIWFDSATIFMMNENGLMIGF